MSSAARGRVGDRASRRAARGITLIELMIVIAIVGTLAVISISAYRGYAERAQRTEALNAMNHLYVRQEDFRTMNHTYTSDLAALGFVGDCTENCVYLVTFDVTPDTRTWRARIEPNPAGGTNGVNQVRDTECSWFTIDALGRRAAENERCLEGR